jgi:hypothetical protein
MTHQIGEWIMWLLLLAAFLALITHPQGTKALFGSGAQAIQTGFPALYGAGVGS